MPKLKHYDNLGTARFVTFCCFRMEPYLADRKAKELWLRHVDNARTRHGFKLFAYVIMPDHVHMVMLPTDGTKLGLVIREIKSKMAREYFAGDGNHALGRRVFWQKRCYDHNCRTPDVTMEKITYCHNNPVRRGLATEPGAYEWSSYNWYRGIKDVPLRLDDL